MRFQFLRIVAEVVNFPFSVFVKRDQLVSCVPYPFVAGHVIGSAILGRASVKVLIEHICTPRGRFLGREDGLEGKPVNGLRNRSGLRHGSR